jgi:cholesterol transport system auxiliary component
MRYVKAGALALLLVAAAGCSRALLGPEAEAPELYRLDTPTVAAAAARLPHALSVARPRAAPSLDTDRIAVVQAGLRFDHYAGLRWAEPAPQMLQSLLVGALQSSGRFEAVLSAPSRVPADLLLDIELQRFEARYASPGAVPVVQVEMLLTLVDTRGGRRISSTVASAEAPAEADRRGEVTAAFERATSDAVAKAAAWLAGLPLPPGP